MLVGSGNKVVDVIKTDSNKPMVGSCDAKTIQICQVMER